MAKPPHTKAEMRVFYLVFRWWELAAGWRDTTHLQKILEYCSYVQYTPVPVEFREAELRKSACIVSRTRNVHRRQDQ
jgi:hypothetical protein